MQEDRTKQADTSGVTKAETVAREDEIARITAEILGTRDEKTPRAEPKQATEKPRAKAKKSAAQPSAEDTQDKQASEQRVQAEKTQSQPAQEAPKEHVRPVVETDDAFKDFFSTTAAVMPKEKKSRAEKLLEEQDDEERAAQPEKKSIFARLGGLFQRQETEDFDEDDDDEEESDLFFPLAHNAEPSYQNKPMQQPARVFAQEALAEPEAAASGKAESAKPKPAGKVRFGAPELTAPKSEPVAPAAQSAVTVSVASKGTSHALKTSNEEKEITAPVVATVAEKQIDEILQQVHALEPSLSEALQAKPAPHEMPKEAAPKETIAKTAAQAKTEKAAVPQEGIAKAMSQENAPNETVHREALAKTATQEEAPKAMQKEALLQEVVLQEAVQEPVQPEQASAEVQIEHFDDLSEKAAFLLDDEETRTVQKTSIFTAAVDVLHDWKAAVQARFSAQPTEEPEQDEFLSLLEEDAPQTTQAQETTITPFTIALGEAEGTAAEAASTITEAASFTVTLDVINANAVDAKTEAVSTAPKAQTVQADFALIEEPVAAELTTAPEEPDALDLTFETVQTAFTTRGKATSLEIDLPEPESFGQEEAVCAAAVPQEEASSAPVQEEETSLLSETELEGARSDMAFDIIVSDTAQEAQAENKPEAEALFETAPPAALLDAAEDTQSADLAQEALSAISAENAEVAQLAQEAELATAAEHAETTQEAEYLQIEKQENAQEAESLPPEQVCAPQESASQPLPEGKKVYCLFDEEADEAAAIAQIGSISFVEVGAPKQPIDAVPELQAQPEQASAVEEAFTEEVGEISLFDQDAPVPLADALLQEPTLVAAEPSVVQTLDEIDLLEDTLLADFAEEDEEPFEDAPLHEERAAAHDALPEDPEGIQFGLTGMRVKLWVRVITTGVFALTLFLLGLMGQGLIQPLSAIDPSSAPVPFLMVNLLFMLTAAGVSYPIFIEGIPGLWRKPSVDTLPALAATVALLQVLLSLMLVETYLPSQTVLFTALAGLILFADAVGSLVMSNVIQNNFNLCVAGVPHYLAYRVFSKDTLRSMIKQVQVDNPALLVNRPVQQMESFLEKSFSPRASDKRAQWMAYALLGGAVLACLIALIKGQTTLEMFTCFAAVVCIGAPLSASLLSALPSLFLQRASAKVGAVVPGWQSIEALGNINLLAVNAAELFPPVCAQLHGIKTFQKERVDLAILYATSILMEQCDTLQGLFAGMIEYKQEMLYPVKDLVVRDGEGFIGWCENYRVMLGTREMMQAEGIALPALDYENRYSKDGERQVLYLAVSGQLYAMFLLSYRGEKNIARALRTLRKEHIRLLVRSTDPTLTAERMERAYRLPAGFITLLREDATVPFETATSFRAKADGCMVHLGNFTSIVGGLKAASAAAQAEQSASAIALVWVGFSVLLSLFLAITGGLMQVSLVAILLYQIAWSALTLGVVLTKKFE